MPYMKLARVYQSSNCCASLTSPDKKSTRWQHGSSFTAEGRAFQGLNLLETHFHKEHGTALSSAPGSRRVGRARPWSRCASRRASLGRKDFCLPHGARSRAMLHVVPCRARSQLQYTSRREPGFAPSALNTQTVESALYRSGGPSKLGLQGVDEACELRPRQLQASSDGLAAKSLEASPPKFRSLLGAHWSHRSKVRACSHNQTMEQWLQRLERWVPTPSSP